MKNKIIGAKVIKKPEDLMPILKEGIDAIPTHKKTNEEIKEPTFTMDVSVHQEILEKAQKEFNKKIEELKEELDCEINCMLSKTQKDNVNNIFDKIFGGENENRV